MHGCENLLSHGFHVNASVLLIGIKREPIGAVKDFSFEGWFKPFNSFERAFAKFLSFVAQSQPSEPLGFEGVSMSYKVDKSWSVLTHAYKMVRNKPS
jgi:hypothetical protein